MSLVAKIFSLYGLIAGMKESDLDADPFVQFQRWFRFARRVGCPWPTSMTLATSTKNGKPSARVMLLKGVDEKGFVFYTNYESRKAGELEENPQVALVFHWAELVRQVRVEGSIEKTSREESNAYFQSRVRGSRIGAWASPQSSVIPGREVLDSRVQYYDSIYKGKEIPLPPYWGGFRVNAHRIEFWQGRPNRLHDRLCYIREENAWKIIRLSP